MGFDMAGQFAVYHNDNVIMQVQDNKYLGNIFRPTMKWIKNYKKKILVYMWQIPVDHVWSAKKWSAWKR